MVVNGVRLQYSKLTFPTDCACDATIVYTTNQMAINEEQDLSISADSNPCDIRTYTWSLSGGGSLSGTTGTNITYTAPATNPGCVNNGLISLLCNGTIVDTLAIAVTAYLAPGNIAWNWPCHECVGEGAPGCDLGNSTCCLYNILDCDGTFGPTTACTGGCCETPSLGYIECVLLQGWACPGGDPIQGTDVRTQTMLDNGCCIYAAL